MKKTISVITLLCLSFSVNAVTQIVTVQNTFFSPSSFTINLGDTVKWSWVNGSHTSTSLSVPGTATPWDHDINSGSTTFIYVPADTGTYFYKCTPHFGFGMMGSFDVACPQVVASINATSSTTFCMGGSVQLTGSVSGNASIFQWRKNGSAIAGATTLSYSAAASGNYTLKATNTCGSTMTSNSISVTVNPLPPATITPTGPVTFCAETNPLTLTANSGAGFTYQWKKANNIPGATNISYVPTVTNTYKVVVTNSNGCSKKSTGIAVTVNPLPLATITPLGPTTFCPGDSVILEANSGTGFTFQWKKGGNNIAGATLQHYTAKTGGTYKLVVTNSSGCSKTSAGLAITVNCKTANAIVQNNLLAVYPNPSNGLFHVVIKDYDSEMNLRIKDISGKTVFNRQVNNGEIVFGENLKPGIYFTELLRSKKVIAWNKIVKSTE